MDAVAFKSALTTGTEGALAQLRVELARKAEMMRFGLSNGLFPGAQAVEAQKKLAHLEGEIRGVEAYFHFVQKCLDDIIAHDGPGAVDAAIRQTLVVLEELHQHPNATTVATADALRVGGSVDEVCAILRRLLAIADESRTTQD